MTAVATHGCTGWLLASSGANVNGTVGNIQQRCTSIHSINQSTSIIHTQCQLDCACL